MLRNILKILSLLMILVTLITCAGCSVNVPVERGTEATADEADATRIYVGKSRSQMKAGEYAQFSVIVTTLELGVEPVYEWISSNPEIASVDSRGRVDALREGTVKISAVAAKSKVEYELTVVPSEKTVLSMTTANTGNASQVESNIINKEADLYKILVNARNNTVVVYTYKPQKDANGEYIWNVAVREMVCSLSASSRISDDAEYNISEKSEWSQGSDGNYYQYCTRFSSDMQFCSTPYSSESESSLIYEEYNKLGTNCTGGDVWLSAQDAKWIKDNCDINTVVMVKTFSNDPLGAPEPMIIPEDAEHKNWDPTHPSEENPYNKVEPRFEGVEDVTVKVSEKFNPLSGVIAYDTCGRSTANNITVDGVPSLEKDGVYTFEKAGTYVISYHYTDHMHRSARADRRITVVSE